jgi:MTH538 TIR-like domain (DUF1863)
LSRRIFFSFYYDADIWRVNQVRNSDVTKNGIKQSGYWDHSLWEETKRRGDDALRRLIDEGLNNTTVTVVLAGAETWTRPWVQYELAKSLERGNGLMTVRIHNLRDKHGKVTTKGADPFDAIYFRISQDGRAAQTWNWRNGWREYISVGATSLTKTAKAKVQGQLSVLATEYDWVSDKGYDNFAKWIEKAARSAGH